MKKIISFIFFILIILIATISNANGGPPDIRYACVVSNPNGAQVYGENFEPIDKILQYGEEVYCDGDTTKDGVCYLYLWGSSEDESVYYCKNDDIQILSFKTIYDYMSEDSENIEETNSIEEKLEDLKTKVDYREYEFYYILKDGLYLCKGPGNIFGKLDNIEIKKGQAVKSYMTIGDFIYIEYGDKNGWIEAKYNDYAGEITEHEEDNIKAITCENVYLKDEPYTTTNINKPVPLNEELKVLRSIKYYDEHWYEMLLVKYNNYEGWVDERDNLIIIDRGYKRNDTIDFSYENGQNSLLYIDKNISIYKDIECKNKAMTLKGLNVLDEVQKLSIEVISENKEKKLYKININDIEYWTILKRTPEQDFEEWYYSGIKDLFHSTKKFEIFNMFFKEKVPVYYDGKISNFTKKYEKINNIAVSNDVAYIETDAYKGFIYKDDYKDIFYHDAYTSSSAFKCLMKFYIDYSIEKDIQLYNDGKPDRMLKAGEKIQIVAVPDDEYIYVEGSDFSGFIDKETNKEIIEAIDSSIILCKQNIEPLEIESELSIPIYSKYYKVYDAYSIQSGSYDSRPARIGTFEKASITVISEISKSKEYFWNDMIYIQGDDIEGFVYIRELDLSSQKTIRRELSNASFDRYEAEKNAKKNKNSNSSKNDLFEPVKLKTIKMFIIAVTISFVALETLININYYKKNRVKKENNNNNTNKE